MQKIFSKNLATVLSKVRVQLTFEYSSKKAVLKKADRKA